MFFPLFLSIDVLFYPLFGDFVECIKMTNNKTTRPQKIFRPKYFKFFGQKIVYLRDN